jgi:para-nitrobenzyl esterase
MKQKTKRKTRTVAKKATRASKPTPRRGAPAGRARKGVAPGRGEPVNTGNFSRAETHRYMAVTVKATGLGRLAHRRKPASVDAQDVVRMNRDTLYSSGVFDLDASPVTFTLPDTGKRYMALEVINEDHYVVDIAYAPARRTYTRQMAGTRYVFAIIRTLADPNDPADVKLANAQQDAVLVEQQATGRFEVPAWDVASLDKARDALLVLSNLGGGSTDRFGRKEEVDPVAFLLASAAGWGGNPRYAADYPGFVPQRNDGRTPHVLKVRDVPVDGFWSITVYNARGFMVKNRLDRYSLNNLTASSDSDGSYTIRFGGDPKAANYLPISKDWNYLVRLYRPRKEILEGGWKFPEAQAVV